MHGVRAPAEVDVVREVDPVLVAHLLRHLQLDQEIATLRVQFAVALFGPVQRVDEPGDVLPRGQRRRGELSPRPTQAVGVRGPGRVGHVFAGRNVRAAAAGGPHLLHHPQHVLVDSPSRPAEDVQGVEHGLELGRPPVELRPRLLAVQREHLPLGRSVRGVVPAHHDGLRSQVPPRVEPRPRPGRGHHRHVPHGRQRRADHRLVVHEGEERVVPRDHPVPVSLVLDVVVVKGGNLDELAVRSRDAYARGREQQLHQRGAHLAPRDAAPVGVVQRGARQPRDAPDRG